MQQGKREPIFLSQPRVEREWLLALAMLSLVFLAEFVGWGTLLRRGGEAALNPLLLVAQRFISVTTWPVSHIQSLVAAQRRIQDLEYGYAEASAQLESMKSIQAENKALREMLNTTDVTLTNRIITVPIVSYGRPFIAGGEQEGISSGAMVLIAQTLVGRVGTVSQHQAEIVLLSQPTSAPILAKTESGVEGVIRGNDKRVLLTEVPTNKALMVGERVVTQGQEGIAPNTLIGRIASITSRPESAVQTAVIEQLVSFYETTVVEVR